MRRKIEENLFITIEGIDGTGKSTVVKLLAQMIGGASIKTPDDRLDDERWKLESRGIRSEKLAFYLKSLRYQKEDIINLLRCAHVVCDRYIHSTIAYQWPDGMAVPKDIWTEFADILKPNFSFLLVANQITREGRIEKREADTGVINNNDHDQSSIYRAKEKFLLMKDLVVIDTTHLAPDAVCEVIMNYVGLSKK